MRTGLYSVAELFGNRHIEQLVIPEIQRDYVWEKPRVKHLLASILEKFKAWQIEVNSPTLMPLGNDSNTDSEAKDGKMQSLQEEFAEFCARRVHATNIGFIYAYSDNDLPGQFFLIDGQQRLTTIYLVLLAVASQDNELKDRFRARYCLCSGAPAESKTVVPTSLDYRLREHTARFLHQWVHHLLETGHRPPQVKDQSWYLQRFDDDITVRNLLSNHEIILDRLKNELGDGELLKFYEYLEDLVQFWYFDTNESAQGEELYIYLNARGESIADNEKDKAQLLATLESEKEKDEWGCIWEAWQDYFWLKRNTGVSVKERNPNADRGFNRFLKCIENLEKLRHGNDSPAAAPSELGTIKKYLKILQWLEAQKDGFKSLYTYADWVDKWFSELWGAFNQDKPVDWEKDQNRMILVGGSLLCVLLSHEKHDNLDSQRIFRAIRVIYLQFHNGGTAVQSLLACVNGLLSDDPSAFSSLNATTVDEKTKWEFLLAKPEHERRSLEEIIWKIEDHPLNLEGAGYGGVNLTHLVDLNDGVTVRQLEETYNAFLKLFPLEEPAHSDNMKKLAMALLYYGQYWNRVKPWYREHYDLRDWPRTIRGLGSEEKRNGGRTVFREFFEEFLHANQSLDVFTGSKKGSVQVDPETTNELRTALIWYAEKSGSRFLEKGMYVSMEYEGEADAYIKGFRTIWNTKGHFKGYSGHDIMSNQVTWLEQSGRQEL
jgi:hypothetical protein